MLTLITDILILGMISGVVASLTSQLGVRGTIIGAVLSSVIAEILKKYIRDPVKDKLQEYEEQEEDTKIIKHGKSKITTKTLFIFPLIVILAIEIIHFLCKIEFIPIDIFYSLEYVANWQLLITIGYALITMGFYPLLSKKLKEKNGILLIIVGIAELIIGYSNVDLNPTLLNSFNTLTKYVNIAIILIILYTTIKIPLEKDNDKHETRKKRRRQIKKLNLTQKEDSIYYYLDAKDE